MSSKVTLIGTFELYYQGNPLCTSLSGSEKCLELLSYLCLHHRHPVPDGELEEILWPQGKILNPHAALKVLYSRIRKAFHLSGVPKKDPVLVHHLGCCSFSPLFFPMELDIEKPALAQEESEKILPFLSSLWILPYRAEGKERTHSLDFAPEAYEAFLSGTQEVSEFLSESSLTLFFLLISLLPLHPTSCNQPEPPLLSSLFPGCSLYPGPTRGSYLIPLFCSTKKEANTLASDLISRCRSKTQDVYYLSYKVMAPVKRKISSTT